MTGTLFGRARGHWRAQLRFDAPTQGSELHRIACKGHAAVLHGLGRDLQQLAGSSFRVSIRAWLDELRATLGSSSDGPKINCF
jgi:hypothetical protein